MLILYYYKENSIQIDAVHIYQWVLAVQIDKLNSG